MTSFCLVCLQYLVFVSSFCSWGLCSQREIHNRSRACSFCPVVKRHDDAKWELNHFLSTARSKSNGRRCQLFSLISALLSWDWQCGKVTCARNWCIRWEFLKPVFFLQPGPAGHRLCSACARVHHHLPRETETSMQCAPGALLQMQPCLWLQTVLQMEGEVGAPHTLCQPHARKSFMLSQQLAAVTRNRNSKWDSSPPGFLLTYSPRTCSSSSSPPGHTMTLRSRVCSRFSWHGAELRLLICLSLLQPLSLMFKRARRVGTSLCSSISLRAQLPQTCRQDGTQPRGGTCRHSQSSG